MVRSVALKRPLGGVKGVAVSEPRLLPPGLGSCSQSAFLVSGGPRSFRTLVPLFESHTCFLGLSFCKVTLCSELLQCGMF